MRNGSCHARRHAKPSVRSLLWVRECLQEAIDDAQKKQSELENLARAASSLAADANGECAATRVLVGDSRREMLVEARKEAEAIAARAEGRVSVTVRYIETLAVHFTEFQDKRQPDIS